MDKNRKFTVEQGYGDQYKKVTMEEGTSGYSDTPHWSSMKDGVGKNTIIFANGFIGMLIPAFIFFAILFGIILYKVLG